MIRKSGIFSFALFALAAILVMPALGAEIFKDKRLVIAASGGAGGGYDNYARLLARHYSRHVPGHPDIRVQNMNAAGGLVVANFTYAKAPKDGTFIGNIRPSVLFEQLFANKAVVFDGPKFHFIGNMNEDTDACMVWSSTGATSIKDFYSRELVTSASGRSAMSFSFPAVYNAVLGTKFKIILGYRGTPERILAMERGEIQATCGLTTSTVKSRLGREIKAGKVLVLTVAGNNPDPDFKKYPNMLDEAKTPDARAALKFLFSQMQPARTFAVPPETPSANVAVLRKAFTATMNDPAFTKDAVKRKTDIKWSTGEATQKMVEELYASDPKAVATVKAALTAKASKRKLTYATATMKIVGLKRKGRRVYYMEDGRKFYVGISGKKTRLTIGGKKAKASKLKVGMSCKVNFAGPYSNAKSVACD
jgi:tripartite-type tricarboxylate transporter receptor subunit TctC